MHTALTRLRSGCRRTLIGLSALALLLGGGVPARAEPVPSLAPLLGLESPDVRTARDVVVRKAGLPAPSRAGLVGRARSLGARVHHEYSRVLDGFSATMSPAAVAAVRREAGIAYVEAVTID